MSRHRKYPVSRLRRLAAAVARFLVGTPSAPMTDNSKYPEGVLYRG